MYVPSNAIPAGYTKQSQHSQILQTEREIFSRGLFKGFLKLLRYSVHIASAPD
jgi:hypothetical protein